MARNPKTRFIPTGSKEKTYKAIPGVVVHLCKDGVSAIGYSGKSNRPDFYFKFPSLSRRNEYVAEYFDKKKKELKERQERSKLAATFKHNLKVGDIVYDSWGYDQTNIDFYEVVAVPSGKSVKIRKIKQTTIEHSPGAMSGSTSPVPGDFVKDEPEMLKRVKPGHNGRLLIGSCRGILSSGQCYPWEGKPMGCSWYA